jgi:hypothetical protein
VAAFLVRWRLLPPVVPFEVFSAFFFDRLDGEGLDPATGGCGVVAGRTGVGAVIFTVGAMELPCGLMVLFEVERGRTATLAGLFGIATTTAGEALTVGTPPGRLARGIVTFGAEGSMLWLICASFLEVWALGLRMMLLAAGTPPTTPGPGTVKVAAAAALLGAMACPATIEFGWIPGCAPTGGAAP